MQEGAMEFAAVIGLDWADKKHDVCIRAQGAVELERGVVQHRPVALQDWVEGLRKRFDGAPIAVVVELE